MLNMKFQLMSNMKLNLAMKMILNISKMLSVKALVNMKELCCYFLKVIIAVIK